MEYNLHPVWNDILEIYKECRIICERHNLRMFGAFGTAIGAVRHHGFIPWDDDFDVLMPRPDYEKFKVFAQQELPKHLRWHSFDTDPDYKLIFGKVRDERFDVLERVKLESNLNIEQGVFIDFFPMDGLPATKLGCFIWHVRRSILRHVQDYGTRPFTIKTFVWRLLNFFYHVSSGHCKCLEQLEKFITRRPYDASENVGFLVCSVKYPKYIFRREWFDDVKSLPFENTMIDIPIGYDQHLRTVYGDYMQLPPVDMRIPSHQTLS